jgi:hypothetical protein
MLRRHFVALGALVATGTALAQGLGLAERRGLAAYQEQVLPGLIREIHQAAGFELPVEVQWDKVAVPGQGPRYGEPGYFTDIYFRPLIAALQGITRDAIGRDALRAKLRRVMITFDDATAPASNYPNGLAFADGTLTINWRPWSNAGDVQPRTEALTRFLEQNL